MMNSFRRCRENCGLTQKQVAVDLGISVQAVSYWETGERKPSYESLFQLADLYGVSLDDLLGRNKEQNTRTENGCIQVFVSAHEASLIRSYRLQNQSVQYAICDILHIDHPATLKASGNAM